MNNNLLLSYQKFNNAPFNSFTVSIEATFQKVWSPQEHWGQYLQIKRHLIFHHYEMLKKYLHF